MIVLSTDRLVKVCKGTADASTAAFGHAIPHLGLTDGSAIDAQAAERLFKRAWLL